MQKPGQSPVWISRILDHNGTKKTPLHLMLDMAVAVYPLRLILVLNLLLHNQHDYISGQELGMCK